MRTSFKKPASALLLSFFLMSVLVLVGMAVSVLVIHDIRAQRTMVAGVQALYAAEGMSELGLRSMKENLPGYETEEFKDYGFVSRAVGSLTVSARADTYTIPCEGQGDWRGLSFNESVQIPLFAQIDYEGNLEEISDFYVEFYVGDSAGNPLVTAPVRDVLRWKILGLKEYTTTTQALSEYVKIYNSHNSPEQPSFLGSSTSLDAGLLPSVYQGGKFFDNQGSSIVFTPFEYMSDFLANHDYNYLVLTNAISESADYTIYYRFHSQDIEGVCEYAEFASTAELENGEVRQDLSTLVKEGENLPVFDFVLYHTGEDKPDLKTDLVIPEWMAP